MPRNEKPRIKYSFPRRFYPETKQKLSNIAAAVSYSDDGYWLFRIQQHWWHSYCDEDFSGFWLFFSGLLINSDKTRVLTMGFSLSELERNRLIEEGFSPDMISTGDKPFKFLGCQIKLFEGWGCLQTHRALWWYARDSKCIQRRKNYLKRSSFGLPDPPSEPPAVCHYNSVWTQRVWYEKN